jgi:hypothetical protein
MSSPYVVALVVGIILLAGELAYYGTSMHARGAQVSVQRQPSPIHDVSVTV